MEICANYKIEWTEIKKKKQINAMHMPEHTENIKEKKNTSTQKLFWKDRVSE